MRRTRYKTTLSLEQIELVEKYNGSKEGSHALFMDPLYIKILKDWYKFLGINEVDTWLISIPELIESRLKEISYRDYPELYVQGEKLSDTINTAIDKICDAYGFYSGLEKENN